MQTQPAIRPSAAPPSPGATPLPAEQRHLSGIERVRKNNELAAAAASRDNKDRSRPGPENTIWDTVKGWIPFRTARIERYPNSEGVLTSQNRTQENIPSGRMAFDTTDAEGKLAEARYELGNLRIKYAKLRADLQPYYDMPQTLEAARAALKKLEADEITESIRLEIEDVGTEAVDHIRDLIADQRVLVNKLTRDATIAKAVWEQRSAKELKPLADRITAIEQNFKQLKIHAISAQLAAEAPYFEEEATRMYWAVVRAFALTRARKFLLSPGNYGLGSPGNEAYLQLPKPIDPAFDFQIGSNIVKDVREAAEQILSELAE